MSDKKGLANLTIIVFLSAIVVISTYYIYRHKSASNKHKPQESYLIEQEKKETVTQYKFDQTLVDIRIKAIKEETTKQGGSVDTSDWKTWGNTDLKIEFKYPPEWGTPTVILTDMSTGDDRSTGWSSTLTFSNNKNLNIDGVSMDFGRPIGFHGFIGFKKGVKRGETPKEFCDKNENVFLFCNTTSNSVMALTKKDNCYFANKHFFQPYSLNYYIDLPEDVLISGFQFQSRFLSDKYIEQGGYNLDGSYRLDDFECISVLEENVTDNSIDLYKELNKAILEKRIDQESIDNYNTLVEFYNSIKILN